MKIPVFYRVLLILLITSLAACALFPLIWWLCDSIMGMDDTPARVFRRLWQILIVIGLLLQHKPLGLHNPFKIGFKPTFPGMVHLLTGVLISWVFLFILGFLYLWMNAWEWDDPVNWVYFRKKLVSGLQRGAAVALVEEYIFRGLIFLSLARRWGRIKGAVVSSLLFSSLHFLDGRQGGMVENPEAWGAGFQLCGQLLREMVEHFVIFPEATGLFLVGIIMCYATYKSGSLWLATGLHGGWVAFFTFDKALFNVTREIDPLWIGGGRLYNGIIPMVGMLIIFPIIWGFVRIGWITQETNENHRSISSES